MRAELLVTDLTRMRGRNICLAGYLGDQTCVRPVLNPGHVDEDWLRGGGTGLIHPFTVIELDLGEQVGSPPHTEDRAILPGRLTVRYVLDPPRRQRALARLDDGGVARIFGADVRRDPTCFVMEGQGARSLGTVKAAALLAVTYGIEGDRWAYRLDFTDALGERYRLAVTDLAYRYFFDHLRVRERQEPAAVADSILTALQSADVYLRIGLARGWAEHPGRCYLQITGVYSFPDYLDGRCWADLALTPDELKEHRSAPGDTSVDHPVF